MDYLKLLTPEERNYIASLPEPVAVQALQKIIAGEQAKGVKGAWRGQANNLGGWIEKSYRSLQDERGAENRTRDPAKTYRYGDNEYGGNLYDMMLRERQLYQRHAPSLEQIGTHPSTHSYRFRGY